MCKTSHRVKCVVGPCLDIVCTFRVHDLRVMPFSALVDALASELRTSHTASWSSHQIPLAAMSNRAKSSTFVAVVRLLSIGQSYNGHHLENKIRNIGYAQISSYCIYRESLTPLRQGCAF